jgi:hypothetical protein
MIREIVVRSLTSGDRTNRDCLVTEVTRQDDAVTTVTRRCTYHIESHVTVPSLQDAIHWAHDLGPHHSRQVYVTKDLDAQRDTERITYKVLGHFYVVLERDVFCIGYRHVLSMAVEPT